MAVTRFQQHCNRLQHLTTKPFQRGSLTLVTTKTVTAGALDRLNQRPEAGRLQVTGAEAIDVFWLCRAEGTILPLKVINDIDLLFEPQFRHYFKS